MAAEFSEDSFKTDVLGSESTVMVDFYTET